jgi:hypothetical protein
MSSRPNRASKWIDLFHEFIENLRIVSKEVTSADEHGTELELWGSQERFLQELADGLENGIRVFVCLKSRQLGVTTISLAIDLFWLAMHPGTKGALVVDSEDNREDFRRTLRKYLESFPKDYFGDDFAIIKGGDNRNGMTFSNGSSLLFLVAGKTKTKVNWGEGKGFSFAHLSELGKYGNGEGVKNFEEALAQHNPDRLVIYESTANGFNHWRDRWLEAKSDTFTQRAFFIGWWANPYNQIEIDSPRFQQFGGDQYTEDEQELIEAVWTQYHHKITQEQVAWYRWRESLAAKSGTDILDQNNPWVEQQAFIASGNSFFPLRKISLDMGRLSAGGPDEAAFMPYRFEVGNEFLSMQMIALTEISDVREIQLRVWEAPVATGEYVIGCDPAYGRNDHKDRSAISVWRCYADRLVQVAEFASADILTKHCAWILAFLAGAYSNCLVNLELGGPGRLIMLEWDHIRDMLNSEAYAVRVKQWEWEDALNNARWYLYHRRDSMGPGYAYNFEATFRTQSELMHGFRGAYETGELDIKSVKLLEEMILVRQEGAHIGAPESRSEDSKDDRVFSAAMADRAWMDWTRKSLMVQGRTYDVVMNEEKDEQSPHAKAVNGIVFNFITRKLNEEVPVDQRPRWLVERGLA